MSGSNNSSTSEGKAPFNVAIIGGGISGMTLALALLKRNIPVMIYEQSHQFKEIGAGVAFTPNAVTAMDICSPVLREAFDKVATGNAWPSKRKLYFDMVDGYSHPTETPLMYSMRGRMERTMVYRAHFLDYLVKHVPPECTLLGKRVENVAEGEDGKVVMHFHDGSSASADIVIGCDGIKSQVRKAVIGANNPALHPVYTGVYAYRGLIPAEKSIPVIGEDFTVNSKMIFGKDGHFIIFPVSNNKILNVVAFKRDPGEWTHPNFTRHATRAEAERDYADWSEPVRKLVSLLEPNLDVWAIYDTEDHPLPQYSKGRICVLGDAAHASSPHQGSGAGMCIEDCAIMASLLGDSRIRQTESKEDMYSALTAALETFHQVRIERSQWLVSSSRRCGELYDWQTENSGPEHVKEMTEEIEWRHEKIWDVDVHGLVKEASQLFGERLAAAGKAS